MKKTRIRTIHCCTVQCWEGKRDIPAPLRGTCRSTRCIW